jgi:hypothetical protein
MPDSSHAAASVWVEFIRNEWSQHHPAITPGEKIASTTKARQGVQVC